MTPFTFFLLLGVALLVGIVAERELTFRRQNSIAHNPEQAGQQTGRRPFVRFALPLWVSRKTDLADQFRTWSTREIDDAALRSWLAELPEHEFAGLTAQIDRFCRELNIDFAWLVTGEIDHEPEIKDKIYEIVVNYCRSSQQASTTVKPRS